MKATDKYFIVYELNHATPNGKYLAQIADISDKRKLLKGFKTKAAMMEFLETYHGAFIEYALLKPIS